MWLIVCVRDPYGPRVQVELLWYLVGSCCWCLDETRGAEKLLELVWFTWS